MVWYCLMMFDDVCLRSELYHGGPIRTPWQSHQLQDPSYYHSWKKPRRLENRKGSNYPVDCQTRQYGEKSEVKFFFAASCWQFIATTRDDCIGAAGCKWSEPFRYTYGPGVPPAWPHKKATRDSPPTLTCIVLWCLSNFPCLISEESWGCLEEALELQKSPAGKSTSSSVSRVSIIARLCEANLVLPRIRIFYDTYLTTTCAPKQKTRGGRCRVASHIMTIRWWINADGAPLGGSNKSHLVDWMKLDAVSNGKPASLTAALFLFTEILHHSAHGTWKPEAADPSGSNAAPSRPSHIDMAVAIWFKDGDHFCLVTFFQPQLKCVSEMVFQTTTTQMGLVGWGIRSINCSHSISMSSNFY